MSSARINKWKETKRKVTELLNTSSDDDDDNDLGQSTVTVESPNVDRPPDEIQSHMSIDSFENSISFHSSSNSSLNTVGSSSDSLSDSENSFHSDSPPLSDSDSEIEGLEIPENQSLRTQLASCAIENRWSRASVNQLLGILRENNLDLP